MVRVTRGFSGPGRAGTDGRLPPGQYGAGQDWPVLSAEPTPRFDTAAWSFTVEGLVRTPTCTPGTPRTFAGYHNHGDPWLEQRYEGD